MEEEDSQVLQIAASLVGMTREEVAAHMKTDPAIVAATEAMATEMALHEEEAAATWSLYDPEMEAQETVVGTATAIERAADQEMTTHERDHTKAMAIKRILASCEDTKRTRRHGLFCGGFLDCSVFLPFITRGKRFFDAISTQGSMPPYTLPCLDFHAPHQTLLKRSLKL